MDEAYERLRKGELKNSDEVVFHDNKEDTTSWEDYRRYAAEGHEIASHTVTHARLAVLDEPNLLYELEQSKKDIEENLGVEYTFSVECPYGTENERVMEYAYDVYPALRNRMPAPYLAELNRGSDADPTTFEKEYVQWQRGPLTDISMDEMKSWVDITGEHDNIWLVLVFHGVNEFGWEPRTDEELEEYFSYIKDREANLWVATFGDVTKYIRERKDAVVETNLSGKEIEVNIKSTLFPVMYNVPLTFKTYVPSDWKRILVDGKEAEVMNDSLGAYVMYNTPLKGIKTTIIIESKAKE
jgi:peptidoglycan/xylan/chitin deacetylase (PgdA/CDA1 family)